MADETVLSRLAEFSPTDVTPRVVDAILACVPGAPELVPYPALPAVVAALGGGPTDVAAATAHLQDDGIDDVLWMSGAIDTGDKGYAVYTGLSSAVRFFFGDKDKRDQALETDAQQRNDAVLKALALSWIAWKAFPGTVPERAQAFARSPAGEAMLTWYAAIELGLPFADNALSSGGRLFDQLMDQHGAAQLQRLSSLAGGRDTGGVQGALAALAGPIKSTIDRVQPHLGRVAGAARANLPGAMATGDKVAGALAGVADLLPVYRYLGGRLAAEAVVARGRAA